MIDWLNLAANSLWILGCSLALATCSYASWQASLFDESLRVRLARPTSKKAFAIAGMLFCTGLALNAWALWEAIVWGVLGVLSAVQLALLVFRSA